MSLRDRVWVHPWLMTHHIREGLAAEKQRVFPRLANAAILARSENRDTSQMGEPFDAANASKQATKGHSSRNR